MANTVDLLTNNHVSPHASKEDAVALAYSYSALALVQHTTTNSDTSILCKCKCLRGLGRGVGELLARNCIFMLTWKIRTACYL